MTDLSHTRVDSASAGDATRLFAQFAHDLRFEDLTEAAADSAVNVLLDTLWSAIAGTHAAGIRELVALMSDFSPGKSRVWFTGEELSPPAATLANSSMTHALEFDDLHSELPAAKAQFFDDVLDRRHLFAAPVFYAFFDLYPLRRG